MLASWEAMKGECAERTSSRTSEFALAAGIEQPDQEFAEMIGNSVTGCIIEHRQHFLRRPSEIRRELLEVCEAAETAAKSLHSLSAALSNLDTQVLLILAEKYSPQGRDQISKLPIEARRLKGLAKLAETFSTISEDKGGPNKKAAFRVLVKGLEKAFEHGRRRSAKVTRKIDAPEYDGNFIKLVVAVLPLAGELAEASGGPRLERPKSAEMTSPALGKYLERLTCSPRAK
jgi:hypothetical protein